MPITVPVAFAALARSRAEADGNVNSAAGICQVIKKNHHHFELGKTLMALSGRCRPAWTRLRPDCRHPAAAAHCETHSHRRSPPNTHQTEVPLGDQRSPLTEPELAWTGVPEHCRAKTLSNGQIITGNDVNTVKALMRLRDSLWLRLQLLPLYPFTFYIVHVGVCAGPWPCVCVGVVAYCCVC